MEKRRDIIIRTRKYACGAVIVKKADPEGLDRKNFKIWTQSRLKSAARAAELGTVYASELFEFEFYQAEMVRLWRYSSYDVY